MTIDSALDVARKYFGIGAVLVSIGFGYAQMRETADALAVLATKVDQIDQRGTTGSRLRNTADEGRMDLMEERITKLERDYADINAKLASASTKLDVIAALLENKKVTNK